jgi:hypothetical protein
MIINQEKFPTSDEGRAQFKPLWDAHGIEIRNEPFSLFFSSFERIQNEQRLIWVVARDDGDPVGYSCHWWYRSMHWAERVAVDDMWYVVAPWRNAGVGADMKKLGHSLLRQAGTVHTADAIRFAGTKPGLMAGLGFIPWGVQWRKTL